MTPFDDALRIVTEGVLPLGRELVALADLAGRVLAEPVVAPFDLPPFDRSAVDGYGVRSADSGDLSIIGEAAAGDDASRLRVGAGEAVRLFTGSGIPEGVDAVVMQEDVEREFSRLQVRGPVRAGQHIRRRGAEAAAGAEVLPPSTPVTPPVISLLATLGYADAEVFQRPTVRILATGSELVPPGQRLGPGQVFESIAPGIRAAIEGAGAIVLGSEVVADDFEAILQALERSMDADILVTCGGVSVGDHDHVRPALAQHGVETRLWGVAMRPGKPFYYGIRPGSHRAFGLPGNPVSAFVTFYLLVQPVLLALGGRPTPGKQTAALDAPGGYPQVGARDQFLCACLSNGRVRAEGAQESHMMSGLAHANALIRLPAGSGPFVNGESVEVIPIR